MKNPTDFTLSWDSSEFATSYKVYQIINGQKVLKSTVSGTTVSYYNMPPGQYQYEVHSYSSRFGESEKGTFIEVTLAGTLMQAPGNLSYVIKNGNDLALKWDPVQYASGYKIYQLIDGELVLKTTVTGTSYTFTNVQEGEHDFVVKSYSILLGESNGAEIKASIDFPVMDKPGNLTRTITNGNDITLRWNAAEFATGYKIYQIIEGEKVLKKTVSGTSVVFTNMAEEEYNFEVYSYSDRFGESTEGSKVDVKIVFPIMQASENLTQSISNGNDIILKWKAADYAKEYRVYQVINGEKKFIKTTTGTSISFTNMPEGDYHFEVHSYSDRFGESPEESTIEFNLTWPIVQAPVLVGTVFNANNMTFSWPAVTWANEYRVYKINGENKELIYKGTARSYKVYNLTEETHSFAVSAYSTRFGESVLSNVVEETIVYPIMEAPTASLTLLSETSARIIWDFVTYANGYNIYEIIDGKPVLVVEKVNNLSYTLQNLSYANHEYYVTSYSNSFGESVPSEKVIAKLIVDTTAPETKANAPTGWVNENQLVTFEATDDETGVAKTYYSINGSEYEEGATFKVDKEGINKISYYSIDVAGNKEDIKTVEVKIDRTAANTSSNEPETWVKDDAMVTLTASDEQSGVENTYYSINGSEYLEGSTFVVDKEGINKISYYSIDEAGNKEEAKIIEVKIDKTAPQTSNNVPVEWVKEDVQVTLTATDGHSGVVKTYYSINGSDYTEGKSFTVTEEGIHEISYYSIDQAGNIEEKQSATVKIDKTAPTVSIDLENEYELGSSIKLDYLSEDNLSGIAIEEVTLNDISYKNGEQITFGKPGEYKLIIKVMDAAGWTTMIEKTFIVYIPVTLEVLPKVIKGNKGIFTVKGTLPSEYQSFSFNVSTVTLNGVSAVVDNNGLQKQAEKGHFKFEREDFIWNTGEVNLELRGYLKNGFLVIGKATVETKK